MTREYSAYVNLVTFTESDITSPPGTPYVSTVSGQVRENNTLTISGGNFGVRPNQRPLYYADFENSAVGALDALFAMGWSKFGGAGAGPAGIRAGYAHSHNKCAYYERPSDNPDPSNLPHMGVIVGPASGHRQMIFSSVMDWTIESVGTTEGQRQFKMSRIGNSKPAEPDKTPVYSDHDRCYSHFYLQGGSGEMDTSRRQRGIATDEGIQEQSPISTIAFPERGRWNYFTQEMNYVSDGAIEFHESINGVFNAVATGIYQTPDYVNAVNIMAGLEGFQQWGITQYWDDIYIDNSFARVRLGDASKIEDCRKMDVCPSITWADGTATVTAKPHGFSAGDRAWIYVTNSDRQTNATGYEVSIA